MAIWRINYFRLPDPVDDDDKDDDETVPAKEVCHNKPAPVPAATAAVGAAPGAAAAVGSEGAGGRPPPTGADCGFVVC